MLMGKLGSEVGLDRLMATAMTSYTSWRSR